MGAWLSSAYKLGTPTLDFFLVGTVLILEPEIVLLNGLYIAPDVLLTFKRTNPFDIK